MRNILLSALKELTLPIDHDLKLNGVLGKVWKSSAGETLKHLPVAKDSCYLQLDNFSVCNIQGISCSKHRKVQMILKTLRQLYLLILGKTERLSKATAFCASSLLAT